jgi:hypothetical protein
MKLFALFCFLFLSMHVSFSQKKTKLPCIDKEFSVIAFIVQDSLGNANITETSIDNLISNVNPIFDSICVSFKVCEYRYIPNFIYDSLNSGKGEWSELKNQFHVSKRVNIFFVDNIDDPANAAGFADFGGVCDVDSSGIVIKKSSATTRVLAHELGHFFGLNHTWHNEVNESLVTEELVDGTNSTTKGDHLMDTPADPFIKGSDPLSYLSKKQPCKFIGMMKDKNGNFYDPLVGNIMSYYPEFCDCGFTYEQYLTMAKTFLSKPKMW